MLVLVGYASEYGSTRQIAQRLASELTCPGCQVEVRSLEQVEDVGKYDALVIGSAVHNGAWLGQAKEFVRRNLHVLAERPVWLFSVGMPEALRRPLRGYAQRKEEQQLTAAFQDLIHARGNRLFSGVFEREHNGSLLGRMLFMVVAGRYGDFRDWQAIDAWAGEIARQLAAEPSNRSSERPDSSPLQS